MSWLVRDDEVLASAEVAEGRASKARGLLWRDGIDGVLVIENCRSVHTFGMRFELDVAFLDADGIVLKTVHLRPRRTTGLVLRARSVLEAEAGSFRHWSLSVGDQLEIR
jgi:uncharacterized membrane protein (UPF0127 family)